MLQVFHVSHGEKRVAVHFVECNRRPALISMYTALAPSWYGLQINFEAEFPCTSGFRLKCE